jgi:hypothetical protein
MAITQGTQLGQYEVLGPLDAGGMGRIYRARDRELGREVAIKVLREDYADDEDWLARFKSEARLLASLNHPNIATVHGLHEADGTRYLVMELVPGETLARRLSRGPMPLGEALDVCRQIAVALEAAHDKEIIHRDLKPGNVMITPDDKVKVLDFGLAKRARPAGGPTAQTIPYDQQTREGVIVGTPGYMAPEQARGKAIDKRADVWAFGCVLYEVLAGKGPFGGETYSDILAAVIERTPDWEALPDRVPPRIVELVRRCLQKDLQRRLRDAGDARLEIEDALAELAHPPAAKVAPSSRGRRWGAIAFALVLLSFALGGGLGMWAQSRRAPATPGPGTGTTETIPEKKGPAVWSGQVLLGGATRAFGPRVSPNGQWLAFTVFHEGQAQVGVMKLDSGEWRVLTRDRRRGGLLSGVCWSADSRHIFFDRFFDVPMGVFSASPFDLAPAGAREVPILDKADCPQVVADGSLVVTKLDDGGNVRLVRHWPDGRAADEEVGPPLELDVAWPKPVRALHKRPQVVFCGKVLGKERPAQRRFYSLDLDTKECKPLPGAEGVVVPQGPLEQHPDQIVHLAVSPDDRFVYAALPAGDLFRVVRLALAGDEPPQTVLTLSLPALGLDMDRDGQLYIDQFQRPMEVLRFAAAGGSVERVASPLRGLQMQPVELPDGRVLLPSKVSGRDQLLAGAGKSLGPILEHGGETAPPAVLVDDRHLAFLAGSGKGRQLKIAEIDEDQVRIRLTLKDVPVEGLNGLAASPDGKVLYYVHSKQVWAVSTSGDGKSRKVASGDGVAVWPGTGDLLIQRFEKAGVRLLQVSPQGGERKELKIRPGLLRLAPSIIGGRAIDKDGNVVLAVASKDNWFWRVALLDSRTGKLAAIPVELDGDILPSNWGRDGKVLSVGYPLKSELWRLTPQK